MNKKNKKDNNKKNGFEWLIITIIILLFVFLTFAVSYGLTVTIDAAVYLLLMKLLSPLATLIFLTFTTIGSTYGIISVTVLVSLFLLYKGCKKYAWIVFTTPVWIYILNETIKFIVQRPRPNILAMIDEVGYSFPSGHTMQATALYGLFILLAIIFIKNKVLKRTIILISLIIILGIASSRIYLGVHYFSDIIGGFMLSLAYILMLKIFFFTKKVE